MEFYDSVLGGNNAARGKQAAVAITPAKNCWVLLPPIIAQQLFSAQVPLPLALQLHPVSQSGVVSKKPCFVAWAGGVSEGGNIAVPSALAAALGLVPGTIVHVHAVPNLPAAASVTVEPLAASDWEVLELNAGLLEDQMLHQVGVVAAGQPLGVWVRQALVRLRATATDPGPVVRLVAGSEVYVAPKPRQAPHTSLPAHPPSSTASGSNRSSADGVAAGAAAQQVRPVAAMLRVQNASSKYLLDTTLLGLPSSPASANHTAAPAASAPAVVADTSGIPQIKSWMTTAAFVNPETLAATGLKAGQPVEVSSKAGLLKKVVLTLLPAADVAPYHLLLTPPLQHCLGVLPHTLVRVTQVHNALQLPALPTLVMHPLVSDAQAAPTAGTSNDGAPPAAPPAAGRARGRSSSSDARSSTDRQRQPLSLPSPSHARQQHQGPFAPSSPHAPTSPYANGLHRRTSKELPGHMSPMQQLTTILESSTGAGGLPNGQPGPEPALGDALLSWQQGALSSDIDGLHQWLYLQLAAARQAGVQGASQEAQQQQQEEQQQADCAEAAACCSTGAQQAAQQATASVAFGNVLIMHIQMPPAQDPADAAASSQAAAEQAASAAAGASAAPAAPLLEDHIMLVTPERTSKLPAAMLITPATMAASAEPSEVVPLQLRSPIQINYPKYPSAQHAPVLLPLQPAFDPSTLTWLRDQVKQCRQRLLPCLHLPTYQRWKQLGTPHPGGLLVSGGTSSGKTAVVQALAVELAAQQVHVLALQCKQMAGADFGAVAGVLHDVCSEAVQCAPCLLVLEDLDLLCPAAKDGPEDLMQDTEFSAKVSEHIVDLLEAMAARGLPLAWAATVKDAAALPVCLRQAGAFDHQVRLPAPGSSGRAKILANSFSQRGFSFPREQLELLAGKADGYDASDLQVLLERAVHAALARQLASGQCVSGQGQVEVSPEDMHAAFEGFVPAAFWGVQKSAGQGAVLEGWQDIGGLANVVAALQDALVVPNKYAALVAEAPLRLRTGVLLYGPPGCGKTHAVSCAAAATGMRFISVKGPELLNKYIGASEAAVRELFQRASAAAPCILFFDEFDAIAPPRGHDSTGVTDRVVNQLLTELDGVEGLKGVAVLAATSRPDLIDAALLRPGRLDRLVYCGLPDEAARMQILQALSRKLPLAGDVELGWVAGSTSDLTGADLSAVLSEAQLAAVHGALELQQAEAGSSAGAAVPVISMDQLRAAVAAARPSLPAKERQRLAAIYQRFQQSKDPGLGNTEEHGQGPRATLA